MRLVELSEEAVDDLLEICGFLGKSAAGEEFLASVLRARENLKLFPFMGTTEHPLAPGRRVLKLRSGYLLSYEVKSDADATEQRVILRRIFHGARQPGSL